MVVSYYKRNSKDLHSKKSRWLELLVGAELIAKDGFAGVLLDPPLGGFGVDLVGGEGGLFLEVGVAGGDNGEVMEVGGEAVEVGGAGGEMSGAGVTCGGGREIGGGVVTAAVGGGVVVVAGRSKHDDVQALAKALSDLSIGRQPSLSEDLKHTKSPVMIIVGERDEKFKKIASNMCSKLREGTEIKGGLLKHPYTMVEIPNCGHAVHLEDPLRVIRLIREFITR